MEVPRVLVLVLALALALALELVGLLPLPQGHLVPPPLPGPLPPPPRAATPQGQWTQQPPRPWVVVVAVLRRAPRVGGYWGMLLLLLACSLNSKGRGWERGG